MSATLIDDRLGALAGEGDGERERTTEARCGTTTPIEALRSYLARPPPPPPSSSSSAPRMSKRGSPRCPILGEFGAEEGCVAYLDCARFREKMATDGFGTASRSLPPNLDGERCLAARSGLGESLVGTGGVAGASFGGVGSLVGSAFLIGDFERETDLPAAAAAPADLGGSPNRESALPPPSPAPSLRLVDLDLEGASEAALVGPKWTAVTYLTALLISPPPPPPLSRVPGRLPRRTICRRAFLWASFNFLCT